MDYKKVDRIADRIKNPTKKKPEDRMMQVIDKRTGKNIFVKKSEVMKDPKKYFPAKSNYEAALAIAKSREPGSRVSVPDIERAMQSIQGKRKGGLTGGQKKLDKNKNNRIDAQDFKILKAEKAKGRGMGLQDEKVKPGKVMKASKGGESKYEKLKRAFPEKSPEGRAKLDTMLGSKYTPMKKERLFAGSAARRKEGLKKLLKNVRKAIPGVGMLDVKVTKKSKGGGADMGTKMSDKRKRRFKEILERLKSPTTINIKSEYKPGTRSPMQRDRKREGYRAKVESKGGKVLFMDEMKKGGSVMARGCKLGRKKATKLY